MSGLEANAKPILTPAITRSRPSLRFGSAAQRLAATWALKTVLVIQAAHSGGTPIAPRHHFEALRHRELPPGVTIWISSHYRSRFDATNYVYMQKPLALDSVDGRFEKVSDFGYVCFLGVGDLSFLLIGHGVRNRVTIEIGSMLRDGLTKVWPPVAPVIAWPPHLVMDKDLVEILFLPDEPQQVIVKVAPV